MCDEYTLRSYLIEHRLDVNITLELELDALDCAWGRGEYGLVFLHRVLRTLHWLRHGHNGDRERDRGEDGEDVYVRYRDLPVQLR